MDLIFPLSYAVCFSKTNCVCVCVCVCVCPVNIFISRGAKYDTPNSKIRDGIHN